MTTARAPATPTTRLTYDECMARLAACPALPRGEVNLAALNVASDRSYRRIQKHVDNIPKKPCWRSMWSAVFYDTAAEWRQRAAPLRKAREQRQRYRKMLFKALADEQEATSQVHALREELRRITFSAEPSPMENTGHVVLNTITNGGK